MNNTFIIRKSTKEVKYKDRKDVKTFCTLDDTESTEIMKFNSFDQAMEEIKKSKYLPDCSKIGNLYLIIEYLIECCEFDEDGEFISGSDYDCFFEYEFDVENDSLKILNNGGK